MAFSNIGIRCTSLKMALVHSQVYHPWYVVKALVCPKTVMVKGQGNFLSRYHGSYLFACVEVLRPSQLNGVMSSAVSLPNHTFTGQA